MDNNGIKIGVISGIISSVLAIIFINPILSFVWKVTVGVTGSIHQGYVDRIYRDAATPETNILGHVTFLAVLVFGTFTVMFEIFGVDFDYFRLLSEPRKAVRSVIFLMRFTTVLLLMTLVIALSISTGIATISASFSQRLTVLAPAIDDLEYKTLKASWASMRTKADYDAIVSAMDRRAKELRVTLPSVREP